MTQPAQNKVKLEYYKTNIGIFLRSLWGSSYNTYFENYKFNGQQYGNTLQRGYLFLEGIQEITKVEKKVAAKQSLVGYALNEKVNETLRASLKPYYSLEECGHYLEDGYTYFKNKEFAALCSMYKESYETIPEYWEECDVTHVALGNIIVDNWQEPEKMVIRTHQEGSWNNKIGTNERGS